MASGDVKPLSWDVTRVAGRYFTRQEWGKIKRLIRDDGVDQYEALEQIIAERPEGSVV